MIHSRAFNFEFFLVLSSNLPWLVLTAKSFYRRGLACAQVNQRWQIAIITSWSHETSVALLVCRTSF